MDITETKNKKIIKKEDLATGLCFPADEKQCATVPIEAQ